MIGAMRSNWREGLRGTWGGVPKVAVVSVVGVLVVLFALGAGLTELRRAAKADPPAAGEAVPGRRWALAEDPAAWFALPEVDGAGADGAPRPIRGSDGCNLFFGQGARLGADTLEFGMTGSTRMYCPDHREAERVFGHFAGAGAVALHLREGGDAVSLHLRGPGDRWVEFRDAGPYREDAEEGADGGAG